MEITKERLKQEIDQFNDTQLEQLAEFIEFIKFRSRGSEEEAPAGDADETESKEAVLADFRQSWHEAMTGNTIPISQVWEGLKDG